MMFENKQKCLTLMQIPFFGPQLRKWKINYLNFDAKNESSLRQNIWIFAREIQILTSKILENCKIRIWEQIEFCLSV